MAPTNQLTLIGGSTIGRRGVAEDPPIHMSISRATNYCVWLQQAEQQEAQGPGRSPIRTACIICSWRGGLVVDIAFFLCLADFLRFIIDVVVVVFFCFARPPCPAQCPLFTTVLNRYRFLRLKRKKKIENILIYIITTGERGSNYCAGLPFEVRGPVMNPSCAGKRRPNKFRCVCRC